MGESPLVQNGGGAKQFVRPSWGWKLRKVIMKKFIDITLIFTIVIIIATLTLVLFGLTLGKHQIVALIIFCFSAHFLMLLKLILEV